MGHLSRTIAMLDSLTGWQAGPCQRRPGVVQTRAGAVHRQLEDVPDRRRDKWSMHGFGAGIAAIFWRHRHAAPTTRLQHRRLRHLPVLTALSFCLSRKQKYSFSLGL